MSSFLYTFNGVQKTRDYPRYAVEPLLNEDGYLRDESECADYEVEAANVLKQKYRNWFHVMIWKSEKKEKQKPRYLKRSFYTNQLKEDDHKLQKKITDYIQDDVKSLDEIEKEFDDDVQTTESDEIPVQRQKRIKSKKRSN